jgi:hypothetical protein
MRHIHIALERRRESRAPEPNHQVGVFTLKKEIRILAGDTRKSAAAN